MHRMNSTLYKLIIIFYLLLSMATWTPTSVRVKRKADKRIKHPYNEWFFSVERLRIAMETQREEENTSVAGEYGWMRYGLTRMSSKDDAVTWQIWLNKLLICLLREFFTEEKKNFTKKSKCYSWRFTIHDFVFKEERTSRGDFDECIDRRGRPNRLCIVENKI